jgi:hypothetical protein
LVTSSTAYFKGDSAFKKTKMESVQNSIEGTHLLWFIVFALMLDWAKEMEFQERYADQNHSSNADLSGTVEQHVSSKHLSEQSSVVSAGYTQLSQTFYCSHTLSYRQLSMVSWNNFPTRFILCMHPSVTNVGLRKVRSWLLWQQFQFMRISITSPQLQARQKAKRSNHNSTILEACKSAHPYQQEQGWLWSARSYYVEALVAPASQSRAETK